MCPVSMTNENVSWASLQAHYSAYNRLITVESLLDNQAHLASLQIALLELPDKKQPDFFFSGGGCTSTAPNQRMASSSVPGWLAGSLSRARRAAVSARQPQRIARLPDSQTQLRRSAFHVCSCRAVPCRGREHWTSPRLPPRPPHAHSGGAGQTQRTKQCR